MLYTTTKDGTWLYWLRPVSPASAYYRLGVKAGNVSGLSPIRSLA